MITDSGPDEVLIYPEIQVLDDMNTPIRIPSDTPVRIPTYVQSLSATEAADLDIDPRTTRYFNTSRPLPGGAWAKVVWDGRPWGLVGEPQHRGRSRRTAHTHVVLTSERPQEAPEW